MNYLQPSYYERVKYTLRNVAYKPTVIVEPIGWDEDDKTFERSLKSHGVFTNLSSNLKFHKGTIIFPNGDTIDGGFDFIRGVYKQQGINATILLIKEERNPQTNVWEEAYRGYLFFPAPMVIENNQISIKFKESSFYNSLLARRNEKLELDRLTTIDGATIPELTPQTVALNGRDIFLVSQLDLNTGVASPYVIDGLSLSSPFEARAVPLKIVSSSDTSVQTPNDLIVSENEISYGQGTTENMFYAVSDKIRTFKKLSIDFEADFEASKGYGLRLDLVTYENGTNYDFKSYVPLNELITLNGIGSIAYKNTFEGVNAITLLQGESLCLAIHVRSLTVSKVNATYIITNVNIEEDSFDDTSPKQAKFILPFEALQRIIHITTGEENALVSNLLGRTDTSPTYATDGDGSDACFSGITHGHWIRNFDALPDNDENIFKPLTTSFKDFVESFSSVYNAGYGIERTGLTEKIRFEIIKYFYQKVVTVSLPNQAKKIKRTVANDYFYNALELGNKKPRGDNLYEEAMGLDEYNIKNNLTTPIIPIENSYKKVAPYRADSYGIEFARRQSILTNPTDDTRYDNNIFLMDLKRGLVDVFEQRLWQDDFAKAPTGIYSPETAQNLRFSPMNVLLRHGWWVRAGLNVYKDDYIRFTGSVANSKLSTQLIGGKEYAENGSIQVKDLESPYFEPEIIEFEHEATTEILQNIQGTTLIDGNKVMNYYGLLEFINEDGYFEYGYLLELKPNKEGKWKLLKSSKKVSKNSILAEPIKDFNLTAPVLSYDNLTSNSVDLNWTDTISSVGLANYRVYVDGKIKANPIVSNFDLTGLTANTDYSVYIVALDLDGNKVISNVIEITTLV